jgi:hypothetical protein
MSRDDSSQQPDSNETLQFDVAEHASPDGGGPAHDAGACTQCGGAIASSYYQLNGLVICPRCRGGLDSADGSRARRILAAAGLGMLAALGGSLVYFAIAALTGYEFGLVAIAVGYVVGKAVYKGSRGRGGWAYQTLAIVLTYFAIVSTYVPLAMREFRANPAQADSLRIALRASDTVAADSLDDDDDEMDDSTAVADSALAVTQAGSPANKSAHTTKPIKLGAGMVLLGIVALLAFAAIAPILAGFSNIIGLVIIFFAVFQAWSLNRRVPLEITGPYRVGRDGERVGATG